MQYLNLIREMEKDWIVQLVGENGVWECSLRLRYTSEGDKHHGSGDCPEQAIRRCYLNLNPIEKNTRDGKLSQTG